MTLTRAATPLVVAVALALSACGALAPPRYSPTLLPEATAKARFEIRTDSVFATAVTFPHECEKRLIALIGAPHWVRESYHETSSLDMIGGHASADSRRVERLVPSGQAFLFQYQIIGSTAGSRNRIATCTTPASFVPEAGAQYEISAEVNDQSCELSVSRLQQAGDGSVLRSSEPSFHEETGLQCLLGY